MSFPAQPEAIGVCTNTEPRRSEPVRSAKAPIAPARSSMTSEIERCGRHIGPGAGSVARAARRRATGMRRTHGLFTRGKIAGAGAGSGITG